MNEVLQLMDDPQMRSGNGVDRRHEEKTPSVTQEIDGRLRRIGEALDALLAPERSFVDDEHAARQKKPPRTYAELLSTRTMIPPQDDKGRTVWVQEEISRQITTLRRDYEVQMARARSDRAAYDADPDRFLRGEAGRHLQMVHGRLKGQLWTFEGKDSRAPHRKDADRAERLREIMSELRREAQVFGITLPDTDAA